MKYFILFCFFLTYSNSFELEAGSVCAGKHATSEYVRRFCDNFGGTIEYRCCRSYDNETFVAIDLTEANLTEIPDFTRHGHLNLTVIDLRENPDIIPSREYDFLTLVYLDTLILPDTIKCPGGERVWENITILNDPPGNLCQTQKDFCTNSTDLCVEKGSLCSANGPNHFFCLCKPGYHGYKCLRYGKFPAAIFYGLTAGVTILASVILYWTQRRHVKK